MHAKYSRRWFIKIATLLGMAGSGWTNISIGGERSLDDPLTWRLATFLKDTEGVNIIGQSYLEDFPEENDPYIIVRRIKMSHPVTTARLRTVKESDTGTLIADMVTEDFQKENIVNLNGWILSNTEARLCALTSLLVRI